DAPPEAEEQRREDVGDDEQRVDPDEGPDVAGDVLARGGQDERHRPSTTAVMASANALRTPARSSAASPRAVEPPGEVTSRRTRSVSIPRARRSSAVPPIVVRTMSAAASGVKPRRTPASTCASTISAQNAGAPLISA